MSIRFPDAIVVKLRFSGYSSKGTGRSKPNDVRRWLMGLDKAPTRPFVPTVAERTGISEEDIIPYCFGLVKEPLATYKRGFKNSAVGAVAIYLYSGSSSKFEEVCQAAEDILNLSKGIKSIAFSDYEIFGAKRWIDGR